VAKETFPGKLLRIFFDETDKRNGVPFYEAVVAECQAEGVSGVTVFRGIEGFGMSARIHRARMWPFTKDAPIVVNVIDRSEIVSRLMSRLDRLEFDGLVAISDVEVIRYSTTSAEGVTGVDPTGIQTPTEPVDPLG
jgi:PII-like signaling protein